MIKITKEIQLGSLIQNNYGDNYLFSVNRNNFSEIDYATQFNKEFHNTFQQKDTLYLIIGTDSGLMVKQLLKTPPEKGSAYVFIEFPDIIERVESQYDLSTQKRIIVTTEDKWQEDSLKIGMDIYFLINRVKRIKSFAAQYNFLNEYIFLWQNIEANANHLAWQYQSQIGSKIFIQRQLENLAENHTPAIKLKDYFNGKSALILAGGPSLDNYIEWIEDNQTHFVVIAVTRIARRLLQTKIKPDIFVTVDPLPVNFNVSQEVYHFDKTSLLVNQYHVSPLLLGNWLGVNLFLGELFPWKTALNTTNLTGVGPTVTNTAILLANNLGIKKQILFGVDLCFSPEGYSHASGSIEYNAGPDVNLIGQIVETNKGEYAETNSAYFEAISTIERLAELCQQSGAQVINPSPDSAKIENVDHIVLEDINIPEEQVSIKEFLEKQRQLIESKEYRLAHYKNILHELEQAQFKVNKINKLVYKGLKYNKKLFQGNNPQKNYKYKLKMDKLEKELDRSDLSDFTTIAKKFGANEFLYFLNPDKETQWTNDDIKKSADIYYQALKTGISEFSNHIFTAINRTQVRMIEMGKIFDDEDIFKHHFSFLKKSTLNIDKRHKKKFDILSETHNKNLFSYNEDIRIKVLNLWMFIIHCSYDRHFSRIYLLEKNNPEIYNIDNKTILNGKKVDEIKDGLKNNYQIILTTNEIKKSDDKFEGLQHKLYNLFILKDKKRLENILKGISKLIGKNDNRVSFIHLTQGYIYELEQDIDNAVKEYEFALSDDTIESALKRLVSIALNNNDLENAHTGINLLSQISPEYLPQLGDLYKITKNYEESLEVYTQYLDFNPSDISVLLKMAELYESQDIENGAEFIYETILKIEPDNIIAKRNLGMLD